MMIHVNRSDGKHELLTDVEFELKYGKKPGDGPHIAEADKLRRLRTEEGFGLRELAKVMDVLPSWLSGLEHGREKITPQIKSAYLKGITALLVEEVEGKC